ncbi:MAG: hypothetical protein A2928_00450 [Candidatus Taylorbacteria bacterium RIFCSPLOWO2_01_FULL_45_15b]|uniref:Uncharacterized protein n=1 Tax=Candidatus Taylorbacteria bacterium RIFCSPLOWO2_01_FULL_45_15b TaxID=1802319 RepID=A0A1G2N9U7_9BACT|nr:MAG: hypothetical protein A2928_00450 [Candidatus Taylorbacteria bacterium RIFCSPLOWO2_01_FULL_45_15b]
MTAVSCTAVKNGVGRRSTKTETKIFMKKSLQIEAMKSVRKHTIFAGKPQGSPKGARGYNRNQEKKKWRSDMS